MRVGFFAGTFSPPHIGHVAAAKAFMRQMWLDVLYVVPTLRGTPAATPAQRMEMCRLAFEDIDGVVVSDVAIRQPLLAGDAGIAADFAVSWGGDSRVFCLCGTDGLLALETDPSAGTLFENCYPCYVRRETDAALDDRIVQKIADYYKKYNKIVRKITVEPFPISSETIRNAVRKGEDISSWVAPAVADYILEEELYL